METKSNSVLDYTQWVENRETLIAKQREDMERQQKTFNDAAKEQPVVEKVNKKVEVVEDGN